MPREKEFMSLFHRLFGSGKQGGAPQGPRDLAGLLHELEQKAKGAFPAVRASLMNRAGDLCVKEGKLHEALRYFGEAIDAYLEDQQPEPARGVARKILRIHPGAVRTLCTLTWLDLAAGHHRAAVGHLRDYVRAAEAAGRQELAKKAVLEMAGLAVDREFLEEAAQALDTLGARKDAERVRGWLQEGGGALTEEEALELSLRCLHGAIGSHRAGRLGPGREW